jgi:hypothetical protein
VCENVLFAQGHREAWCVGGCNTAIQGDDPRRRAELCGLFRVDRVNITRRGRGNEQSGQPGTAKSMCGGERKEIYVYWF